MFHIIKEKWPRQEHFLHYMNKMRCTYSLTVQIDITELQSMIKKNGLKSYPVQIYMIASVVNCFSEFRMGLSEIGEPGYWETLHPTYTIFNDITKTFSSIWTIFDERFGKFYESCVRDIERYGKSTELFPKDGIPPNVFDISSVPWVDFTAFNINAYTDGNHLLPIFTIGKYIEQNNKVYMPLAMQLHHSACDGYHAGQFVEAIRELSETCNNWL